MKTTWKRVKAPTTWHPQPGEILSGRYCGRTKKDGYYGQYEVIMVLCDDGKVFKVSGTMIIQLADVALLDIGDEIRVKFIGIKVLANEHTLKEFELWVHENQTVVSENNCGCGYGVDRGTHASDCPTRRIGEELVVCRRCKGSGKIQDFSTTMDNFVDCPDCKVICPGCESGYHEGRCLKVEEYPHE